MDETPLPFEYLSGRTDNQQGEKMIWIQGSQQSGWDKRQTTIQLTIFADAVPHVKPLIFFRRPGVGTTVRVKKALYDPQVVVKFNPKHTPIQPTLLNGLISRSSPCWGDSQLSWRSTCLVVTKWMRFWTPYECRILHLV